MTALSPDNLAQIHDQAEQIQQNRHERNTKYNNCLNTYLDHLKHEIKQFEQSQQANDKSKSIMSEAFQNTYERVVQSSQISIHKLKHTYHQKKEFWNNVIKITPDLNDLEFKKELYNKKKIAEDKHFDIVEKQKDKHKGYNALLGKGEKKEQLKQFQYNNKIFEQKVHKGTATLNQWDIQKKPTYGNFTYQQSNPIIQQFGYSNPYKAENHTAKAQYNHYPKTYKESNTELNISTNFLNNFQKNTKKPKY